MDYWQSKYSVFVFTNRVVGVDDVAQSRAAVSCRRAFFTTRGRRTRYTRQGSRRHVFERNEWKPV